MTNVKAVDISRIAPNLYVASSFYPPDDDMPPNARILDMEGLLVDGPLHGSGAKTFEQTALRVQELRDAGYAVVLRCVAGRNRSAAVAALVLINQGWTPEFAIERVRHARKHLNGGALTNPSFVAYLESLATSEEMSVPNASAP